MKKFSKLLILVLILILVLLTTSCDKKTGVTIAIPNDTTNEARALLLLEDNGLIKLKEGVGILATIRDIEENPYDIEFKEVEAAQIPNVLPDVSFAVINSNYAISAGINPVKDSLIMEGASSYYANILAVKEGNENLPIVKALIAALSSSAVKDFINKKYEGSVVSTIDNPTDGFDQSINYDLLKGESITVACSPTPHAEILSIAKEILKEKEIELVIDEYTDYVVPNNIVEDETVLANYFQHVPYLDDFNKENGTHIVSVCAPHVEPMGLYKGGLETEESKGIKELN